MENNLYDKNDYVGAEEYFWKIYEENHLGMLARHNYDVIKEMSKNASKYLDLQTYVEPILEKARDDQRKLRLKSIEEGQLSPEDIVKFYFNEGYIEALKLVDMSVSIQKVYETLTKINKKLEEDKNAKH